MLHLQDTLGRERPLCGNPFIAEHAVTVWGAAALWREEQ